MSTPPPPPPPPKGGKVTEEDLDCASLARAALFPSRYHRDVAHDGIYHFPALIQLDFIRSMLLKTYSRQITESSLFPPRVIVVRKDVTDNNSPLDWNGKPDVNDSDASFVVIPNKLEIQCTSLCDQLLPKNNSTRKAYYTQQETKNSAEELQTKQTIVLCSDRILKAYNNKYDRSFRTGAEKEPPTDPLHAVEEVVSNQLVQLRHFTNIVSLGTTKNTDTLPTTPSSLAAAQIEAAKVSECYFSQHKYNESTIIKKGSRLQTGYSLLPSSFRNWCMNQCIAKVSMEHLMNDLPTIDKVEAKKVIQEQMKKQ